MIEIIVALLGLAGVALSVYAGNRSIKKQLNAMDADNKAQHLAILRLTVMNSEMPMSERIAAGAEYIKRHGNGDVKHYYEHLLAEHVK